MTSQEDQFQEFNWGALVLAKNQEGWIRPQLNSLYPWVSRIVVVDGAWTPDRGCTVREVESRTDHDLCPSVDGTVVEVDAYTDPEGKVELLQLSGSQVDALNMALDLLDTPLVYVVSADEFLPDLGEFLRACERQPEFAAFEVHLTEFANAPDLCFPSSQLVLAACKPEGGFRFGAPRNGCHSLQDVAPGNHESARVRGSSERGTTREVRRFRLDESLLRYGAFDDWATGAGVRLPTRFVNSHPPAIQELLSITTDSLEDEGPGVVVSIIVPFFNKVEWTRRCAAAVLATSFGAGRFELLLQDDGSTESLDSLQALLGDPRVRLLQTGKNVGFLHCVQKAAANAKGTYLVLLNNDTIPRPGWLEALVGTVERAPDVGIVGAKLLYPDGRLQEAGGIVYSDGSGCNYGKGDIPHHDRYSYVRDVDYCSGAALLVRRKLWEQIGGFDERFAPAYYEDTDLCMEARRAGYRVVFQPRSEVVHVEGLSSGTDLTSGVKRYQAVNREKFVDKWRPVLEADHCAPGTSPTRACARFTGKHILLINPSFPLFDRDSGSFRLLQMVRLIRSMGHRVTFVARADNGNLAHRRELEELGVRTLIGRNFDEADCPNRTTTAVRLRQLVEELPIDVAICHHYTSYRSAGRYLRRFSPRTSVVVDSVDIHFRRIQREAELTGDRALHEQAKRIRRKELSAYRAADLVLAISEDEAAILRNLLSRTQVEVLSNIHPLPQDVAPFEERRGLLFIGSFDHPPNGDAVRHLVEDIMPIVWLSRPDLKLRVVGQGKDPKVECLASDRVELLGQVEDLDLVVNQSLLLVAPLRFGGGAKGKVGQALASGLPVVTTLIGAEGMGLIPGEHYGHAEDSDSFSQEVLRLSGDPTAWRNMSNAGRELIESQFSPGAVARQLETGPLHLERRKFGLSTLRSKVGSYLS